MYTYFRNLERFLFYSVQYFGVSGSKFDGIERETGIYIRNKNATRYKKMGTVPWEESILLRWKINDGSTNWSFLCHSLSNCWDKWIVLCIWVSSTPFLFFSNYAKSNTKCESSIKQLIFFIYFQLSISGGTHNSCNSSRGWPSFRFCYVFSVSNKLQRPRSDS